MANDNDMADRFFKSIKNSPAAARDSVVKATQVVMRDGTVAAAAREGIKDVRDAIHNFFFHCHEGNREPGAPLNPTHGQINEERRERGSPYGPPQRDGRAGERGGNIHQQKTWQQKELDRRSSKGDGNAEGDGDGYERGQGRSLPDEEKQRERDRDRGGRGR